MYDFLIFIFSLIIFEIGARNISGFQVQTKKDALKIFRE